MQGEINPDETASGEVYSQGSMQKDSLSTAYNDALAKEDTIAVEVGELTAEERGIMLAEMERDPHEKSDQLATILVVMLSKSGPHTDARNLTKALEDLILFAFRRNDLGTALTALRMIGEIPVERREDPGLREPISNFFSFCRSAEVMEKLRSMVRLTSHPTCVVGSEILRSDDASSWREWGGVASGDGDRRRARLRPGPPQRGAADLPARRQCATVADHVRRRGRQDRDQHAETALKVKNLRQRPPSVAVRARRPVLRELDPGRRHRGDRLVARHARVARGLLPRTAR